MSTEQQDKSAAVVAVSSQVWKLTVYSDQTALLTCDDSGLGEVYRREVDFTEFAPDEADNWLANHVFYRPCEM